MGKGNNRQRKTRLDTATTEFIGFGAFANTSSNTETTATKDNDNNNSNTYIWSPVYTGNNEQLVILFPRLYQKRDAITLVKCLNELNDFYKDENVIRKIQGEALIHYAWLYGTKLCYDNNSSVRAAAIQVWITASNRIPKVITGILQQHIELLGILYISQVDPATEVRTQQLDLFIKDNPNLSWYDGLIQYTNKILSFGRTSVMEESLFRSKRETSNNNRSNNDNKGSNANNTDQSSDKKKEQNRDAMEERFERIVGTCLDALNLLIQQHNSDNNNNNNNNMITTLNTKLWWKTINSPKPNLRRKTYQLLTTTAIKIPMLLPDNIISLLTQSLSTEKHFVPTLLETILTILMMDDNKNKNSNDSNNNDDNSKNNDKSISLVISGVMKPLQKACYGAPLDSWGPMILPLIAAAYKKCQHHPEHILEAAAKAPVLSETDQCKLKSAIAESALYLLLQKSEQQQQQPLEKNTLQSIAKHWMDCFRFFLTLPPSHKRTLELSQTKLIQGLTKHLIKLMSIEDCYFTSISDWFWNEQFKFPYESHPLCLAQFIKLLNNHQQQQQQCYIMPPLKHWFETTLAKYQGSSGDVPSMDVYEFLQASIDYYITIYNNDNNNNNSNNMTLFADKFVMNDLLRWTIIHTSRLSDRTDSELASKDFILLASCLNHSKDTTQWESFVREILAAKCDVGALVVGLHALLNKKVDWIPCQMFDDYAIQLAKDPTEADDEVGSVDTDGEDSGIDENKLSFFRTCLGLEPTSQSTTLVGNSVIHSWVDHLCSSDSKHNLTWSSLLCALLQTIQSKTSLPVLSDEQEDRILQTSWRSESSLFASHSVSILHQENSAQLDRFLSLSSCELKNELLDSSRHNDRSFISSWALRAWRLSGVWQSKVQHTGMEELSTWKEHPNLLFQLAMAIFDHIPDHSHRWELMQNWSQISTSLLWVDILVAITEASNDALLASRVKCRHDRSGRFLKAICGPGSDIVIIEKGIDRVVNMLKDTNIEVNKARSCVAVLSQLIDLVYDPVIHDTAENLDPKDISDGQMLWYILDPKDPSTCEYVQVVKVHYDAHAGHYFTVRLHRNGECQERQTVIQRLRRSQPRRYTERGKTVSEITEAEWTKRIRLSQIITKEIIIPQSIKKFQSYLGELVNVVLNQIGVGEIRGVGSLHYDLHTFTTSMFEEAVDIARKGDTDAGDLSNALWALSLASGFALNTPNAQFSMSNLGINPVKLTKQLLLGNSDEETILFQNVTNDALLAWLIASHDTLMEYIEVERDLVSNASCTMFEVAAKVLEASNNEFSGSVVIACRAIYDATYLFSRQAGAKHKDNGEDILTSQRRALTALIYGFASGWENELEVKEKPRWLFYSCLPNLMMLARDDDTFRNSLAISSSGLNASALATALYDSFKCRFAFTLLEFISSRGIPLQKSGDEAVILGEKTSLRLNIWLKDLDEEEAAELEEDVYIVAEWAPLAIMADVEHWSETSVDELVDPSIATGRLLTWLSFLQFIEAAAPKDFRNRPAFVSYLSKCEALSTILNSSLLFDEGIGNRTRKVDYTFLEKWKTDMSELDIGKLSSLSIFRTIEILPSLSRRWWEEDCPKVYTNSVQVFVEKIVSPEILKRELDRIKVASSFGSMAVSASLISREITATYLQDDFTLKVLISLPSAFPLRSAEVDCSKTLGVPDSRSKRWSLQIMLMLNNQGGTLQDALLLWKDNVDKEFEGVEPCPVCYSVLHVKTHKLPCLECKTCRNRFHVDCLTQWFRSSGKTQCVLCQQPWQGSRIQ